MVYRASNHAFELDTYFKNCNRKDSLPQLTLIQSEHGPIFGTFLDKPWDLSTYGGLDLPEKTNT